jgi:hypothetical protein
MISRRLCAARPRVRFPRRFNAIMFVSASPSEASTPCLDRSAIDGWDFGKRQAPGRPIALRIDLDYPPVRDAFHECSGRVAWLGACA